MDIATITTKENSQLKTTSPRPSSTNHAVGQDPSKHVPFPLTQDDLSTPAPVNATATKQKAFNKKYFE